MEFRYLSKVPKPDEVPSGLIVWHNHVRPTRRRGSRGFRAYLSPPDPERLVACECDWAPELDTHYRVRREEVEA
jgi:hypothetical protein